MVPGDPEAATGSRVFENRSQVANFENRSVVTAYTKILKQLQNRHGHVSDHRPSPPTTKKDAKDIDVLTSRMHVRRDLAFEAETLTADPGLGSRNHCYRRLSVGI